MNYTVKLNDPKFKGAVQSLNDVLMHQAIASNGTFLSRILKEAIYVRQVVILFKDAKTLNIFDGKIEQIIEAGLIDYFNGDYSEHVNPKRYEHLHTVGPEVLTLQHLRAGFIIWILLVVVAILTFVGEWIVILKDLMIILSLFTAFYETQIPNTSKSSPRRNIAFLRNRSTVISNMEVIDLEMTHLAENEEAQLFYRKETHL